VRLHRLHGITARLNLRATAAAAAAHSEYHVIRFLSHFRPLHTVSHTCRVTEQCLSNVSRHSHVYMFSVLTTVQCLSQVLDVRGLSRSMSSNVTTVVSLNAYIKATGRFVASHYHSSSETPSLGLTALIATTRHRLLVHTQLSVHPTYPHFANRPHGTFSSAQINLAIQ
jgi:hypothetical protein